MLNSPRAVPRRAAECDGSSLISIRLDQAYHQTRTYKSRRKAASSTKPHFIVCGSAASMSYENRVLGSFRGVNAAFRLGSAAPAAGTGVLVRRSPARTRHASDRQIAGGGQRMRRQFGELVDRLDLFARHVGERIEFQLRAVVLDDGNLGARAALKTLASVDPGRERLERPRQRFHLADTAAGIGIGEPQFAIGILARARLFQRLDRG